MDGDKNINITTTQAPTPQPQTTAPGSAASNVVSNVAVHPEEKITSRRSRKDEEGRDFQCGCGKRYLSYPALYTHIKTKHDGKQPEGTQKTGTNQIAKRTKIKLEEETLRVILAYFNDY